MGFLLFTFEFFHYVIGYPSRSHFSIFVSIDINMYFRSNGNIINIATNRLVMPKEVGLKIGGKRRPFLNIHIHYYNPTLQKNIRQHSGYEIVITKKLRSNDLGTLLLGNVHFAKLEPLERDVVYGPDVGVLQCN